MTKLKNATNNLVNASKEFMKTLLSEGKEKTTKVVTDVQHEIKQAEVKRDIKSKKAADVKQDTSHRKYHRGG